MSIPTIALFASPTSSICSPVHHSCTTGSSDYDFNQRPSSSSPSSSSSSSSPLPSSSPIPKKSIIGGLSRLFSSPSPSVHLSSTFPGSDDTVSLRHDRSDDFGCPYSFSLQKSRDNSPVSVFHGPMSWNTSTTVATAISVGSPSSHKPSVHEFRPGRDRLLHGFVRNALGSCLDYDTVPSSVPDEEELTFDMDDGFIEEEDRDCSTPQARKILLAAQSRHKIFYEDFVTKAFYQAEKAHRGQMRVNGDPYLQHCVETAILLADIGANSTVVAAGILHDTIDDSSMNYNDIFLLFGAGVADLVEEVSKLSQLSKLARDNNTADRIVEADRLHTMFLAMADARAVLIKLADRLHNMMTLDALPIPKQQRFAKETLEIFTPLANRLGIFSWKERLENLCFKHLNPEQHCELSSELDKTFDEAMIVSSKESLEHALDAAEVSFHALYGRHKCLYSIYSKMLKKKLTMKEIHDIHGLRLIVEKESDCYKALDIVHGLWPEVKGRFKDYIENPKLNGYQSLHTVVMSADMVPLEIQIRTKDMHLQAEFGFASHWRYKEYDSKHPLFILQMVEWARWVLTWHCETMNRICYPWGEFGETDFITTPPCPFPLHSKDCPFSYTQQGDHDGPVFVILMENEKMRVQEFPAHSTLKDLLERVGDGSYQCTAFSFPLKEELRLILNHEMVTDFEQTLKMGDVVQLIPSIPDRYLTEQQCSSILPSSSVSSASSSSSNNWHCPKCRLNYAKDLIPREYLCFCGKVESPPPDPWILPHSCGEICGRSLRGSCGHECLLLCHPGPCPPCPKFVSSQCFCGSTKDVRRCALKAFSCNKQCCRLSACGLHKCPEKCHEGICPPCRVKSVYKCLCGRLEEVRECFEHEFHCETSCNGILNCGKHPCERGCHPGSCGDCPLKGKRTCPCGKKFYHGMTCDAIVPTCGSTCEKKLSCNLHRCPERCHRGKCAETCRIIKLKFCRCGSLKKEIPCHQDLSCERKCQRLRDCGRHACKRRCCDGNCPPCPEICGRKLRCNNHKCPSPCHRGTCSPCPLMVTISCFCGETHFEVPCGVEKDQKPPKCPRPCQVSRLCRHSSVSRKHKCHYGACPPCRMICKEQLSCDHICKQRCHGPVPPANPEFTLKPKKKKKTQWRNENKPGTPCVPCQEIVVKSCLGNHIGGEQSMLCSDKRRFLCPNLCGNILQCGNHYCTKDCHVLKQKGVDDLLAQSCEECLLPCQKERELTCKHPCSLPCHINDCPPCKMLIKRSCHCGAMVHVFECMYFNSLSDDEQQNVRTCRGPCHRKLLNCPHLCPEICHPGQCPSIDTCNKKVTVRCACQNLKKEWRCQDVQNAYHTNGNNPKDVSKNRFGLGILPCNSECMVKLKARDSELLLRKTNVVESKVPANTERFPKRRKKRERVKEEQPISRFQGIKTFVRRLLMILMILLILSASMYYGYKGIFRLSDWMNEIENKRPKKSYTRF